MSWRRRSNRSVRRYAASTWLRFWWARADTQGNTHAADIDTLAAAGITIGCHTDPLQYCPNQAVTRAEMATLLNRALKHPPPTT